MPDINVPNIDLSKIDFSKIDLSKIDLSKIDMEKAAADVNNALKEAAYVVVGLGVLGFQRAQVQRVELLKQLETQLAALSAFSNTFGAQAESYVATVRQQAGELRSQLAKLPTDVLPSEAIDPAALRTQLTELAKSVDEAVAPVRQQFEEQLDRLEEVLPPTARELVQSVRGVAATQEQAFRTAVGLS